MLGDPAALGTFKKVLAAKGATDAVRAYTIHGIGKYGSHADEKVRAEAMGILVACLKDKKDIVKESALLALGSFQDAAVIPALVKEGLGDADSYAKIFAAHSLGRIAGRAGPSSAEYKRIAKSLAEVAENDRKDRWLFQAGSVSLASMAYSEQEKPLLELMDQIKTLNMNSASAVVLSLGIMGSDSPAVAKKLQAAFESRAAGGIQAYAGLAMAMAGAPGTADTLAKSLKAESRPQPDVARTAALAIGLVGGAKEADILVGIIKGDTVGLQGDGAKVFLMGAAVQGLGLIGDGDTVKKLKPVLESRQWLERAFATAALGYMLEPKAESRVSPRISEIFRHHNYHQPIAVVKTVQSIL
jgi:HEAT repeat protein